MAYKLVISNNANENINTIVDYLINHLSNCQAAKTVIDDIEAAYVKLEESAEMYPLCNDSYLARKGYRKILLDKHDYIIIYQVHRNEVYISGIFHTRENYLKKL